MSEHQAFAAESLDCAKSVAKFAASFERNEFNPQARRNRSHALWPRSRRIRCIEGNEPRVAPIAAVLDGDLQAFIEAKLKLDASALRRKT